MIKALIVCSKDIMSHVPTVPPVPTRVAACLEVLEGSANPCDSDRDFAAWARLQLLTQEARRSFGHDDSEGKVRIADAHVNLVLAAFENQLIAIMKKRSPSPLSGAAFHP